MQAVDLKNEYQSATYISNRMKLHVAGQFISQRVLNSRMPSNLGNMSNLHESVLHAHHGNDQNLNCISEAGYHCWMVSSNLHPYSMRPRQ